MRLSSLIPSFQFSPRQHWPWLLTVALAGGSALVALFELPQLQAQNHGLQRQVQSLSAQLKVGSAAPVNAPGLDLAPRLAGIARLSAISAELQVLAGKNGLVLSEASNKPLEDAVRGEIGRMEIAAHLKGAYPALKKTVAALLAGHDGLALESLSLRRSHSTDALIDIDVRFTFFYRRAA